jgi:mannose-6-phosphate isomerase-like protein (cupin superfamily)
MQGHHRQDESLTVVSGRIGYQQPGGEKEYACVGKTMLFKAGTPHKFWNAGNECFRQSKPLIAGHVFTKHSFCHTMIIMVY